VLTVKREVALRGAPAKPFVVTYSYIHPETDRTVNGFLTDPATRLIRQFDSFHEAQLAAIDYVSGPSCPDSVFVHVVRSLARLEVKGTTYEGFDGLDPRAVMRDAAARYDAVRAATFRKPNAKAMTAFERFVADILGDKPGR
jgi:hypothetical protein